MPSLVRSIAAATTLLTACTLATAAPDSPAAAASAATSAASSPAASSASSPAAGLPRRPSILVVFDVDMEVAAEKTAPEVVRQARDAARRQAFDAITARLKAWGQHEGVSIDTALFAQGKKLDMAGRKLTHLVVEKITQAAIDNSHPASGPQIDTRKWKATAYDTSNRAAKAPRSLGGEDFISDGPSCFAPPTKAADDDCRADYLRLLTSHLRWIDVSWGEVLPAPR
ncbi:MAG: hypothetical protein IPG93_09145 [Burkholderiales bacterium]|nr:hypothetical protein [Burkholderiales bacterium]